MRDLHSGGLQRRQPVAEACVNWHEHAQMLAAQVTHPASRWRAAVEEVPRHVFVPRWWSPSQSGRFDGQVVWELKDGAGGSQMWLREGALPVYGASATITPDGGIHLRRGRKRASLNQEATS
jgi:hypothetical protein